MTQTKYKEFDPRAFYRKAHPEYFSDSSETYEVELTREMFDFKMSQLATLKQHSDFEKFVVALVTRKITPNVIPQSGPDGGGDGKIDAETYTVSFDVSDKWYSVEDGGARGDEKWAIAISCKEQYKQKIESDVKKIVETKRGYSRILCFTSQVVKGSTRVDLAQDLSLRYGIKIEIFDRTWLSQVVFDQGCYDIAVEKLPLAGVYKQKKTIVGPLDSERMTRFSEIEKLILRPIEKFDMGHVSLLQESYELARGMGRPKDEVYGLFQRALDACEKYGTIPQKFNIFYDRAWTAVFWFADFERAFLDYAVVKNLAVKEMTVVRIEKLSNLLSVLHSAARYGFFDAEKVAAEMSSFEALLKRIENDPIHRSSYLFAKLFDIRCKLMARVDNESEVIELVAELRRLLIEASKHVEISLKSQFQSLEILSNLHKDCEPLDDLVDELSIMVSQAEGEIAQADVRLERAQSNLEKGRPHKAIEHLGFCIRAYDREECQDRLIKAAGLMGMALWQWRLPYSAEAYLSKAACFLYKRFRKDGYIPHLLHTVLRELCEIELFLGRLVMYLNWHRFACIVSNDAQYKSDAESITRRVYMEDAAWLCRFSVADLEDASIAYLPDILDREGLCISADYLRYALGYADEVSEEAKRLFEEGSFDKQPVFEQFLDDLNVSSHGAAYARTTVNNLTVRVDYENTITNQNVAEILLASVEALFATTKQGEIASLNPEVCVKIEDTGDVTTSFVATDDSAIYILRLSNKNSYDSELWNCCAKFVAGLFARNIMTKGDPEDYIDSAQERERTMDRVNAVQQLWMAKDIILGNNYPHLIESWVRGSDRMYGCRVKQKKFSSKKCRNETQFNMPTYVTTQNREFWIKAGWCGTMFLMDPRFPPFIGLMFDNLVQGRKIVEEWRARSVRGELTVKIVILRGIDRSHPTWYRVCILPDVDLKSIKSSSGFVSIMCQRNTMTPDSSKNLDSFEQDYKVRGGCWVAAVDPKMVGAVDIKKVLGCSMPIRSVRIMYVHEIKDDDDAIMALMKGDDPYVPEGCVLSNSVVQTLDTLRKKNH